MIRGLPIRDRCLVMGVLNVTPDSFSDGGTYFERDDAVAHGLALAAEGADLVDVGGESTRPGALRVSADEERSRVLPVIRQLAAAGVAVSVDTMRADVAEPAIDAGAVLVNDVSGGLADDRMTKVVASADAGYVVMHWRGQSRHMDQLARYDNVVVDVVRELRERLDVLVDAGVDEERLMIDPGVGFAKRADDDWFLLANLPALHALGRPVLVGASRKSFLRQAFPSGCGPSPAARDSATLAVSTLAASAGAFCVRVHSVRPALDAVRVVARLRAARVRES